MSQVSSPMAQEHAQRRQRIVRAILAMDMIALVAVYFGGQWDAAEHVKGAVDAFWYPPHYGIYLGLFITALLSLIGVIVILRTPGVLVEKLRANTALVLVTIANLLNFTGAPFDAWWHITFGLDLTVWSPPHVHILVGTVLAALGCAVYFLDDEPVDAPLQPLRAIGRWRALAIFTFMLGLLFLEFFFYEYESGSRNAFVLARPQWMYPVFWTSAILFILAITTAATRRLGVATLVAVLFVLARLVVIGFDRALLDYPGVATYPLIVPALALDLSLGFLWPRWGARRPLMGLLGAGLLATIVLVLTAPAFWTWLGIMPELTAAPWRTYWPAVLACGALSTLAGWWCGTALRRLRPSLSKTEQAPVESPVFAH